MDTQLANLNDHAVGTHQDRDASSFFDLTREDHEALALSRQNHMAPAMHAVSAAAIKVFLQHIRRYDPGLADAFMGYVLQSIQGDARAGFPDLASDFRFGNYRALGDRHTTAPAPPRTLAAPTTWSAHDEPWEFTWDDHNNAKHKMNRNSNLSKLDGIRQRLEWYRGAILEHPMFGNSADTTYQDTLAEWLSTVADGGAVSNTATYMDCLEAQSNFIQVFGDGRTLLYKNPRVKTTFDNMLQAVEAHFGDVSSSQRAAFILKQHAHEKWDKVLECILSAKTPDEIYSHHIQKQLASLWDTS